MTLERIIRPGARAVESTGKPERVCVICFNREEFTRWAEDQAEIEVLPAHTGRWHAAGGGRLFDVMTVEECRDIIAVTSRKYLRPDYHRFVVLIGARVALSVQEQRQLNEAMWCTIVARNDARVITPFPEV